MAFPDFSLNHIKEKINRLNPRDQITFSTPAFLSSKTSISPKRKKKNKRRNLTPKVNRKKKKKQENKRKILTFTHLLPSSFLLPLLPPPLASLLAFPLASPTRMRDLLINKIIVASQQQLIHTRLFRPLIDWFISVLLLMKHQTLTGLSQWSCIHVYIFFRNKYDIIFNTGLAFFK